MEYFVNAQNKVFAFESVQEMELFAKEPLSQITAEQAAELTKPTHEQLVAEVEGSRRAAFEQEADPLFFKWQAGEATQEEWVAKRAEIRERFPKN